MKANFRRYFPSAVLATAALATAAPDTPKVPDPHPLTPPGGGPPVALWQTAPNPRKPYISQIFAPGGQTPLLEDAPPDHCHHHGLMFAVEANGTNFWEETGKNTGAEKPVETHIDEDASGYRRTLEWLAADGKPLLLESRRVTVRRENNGKSGTTTEVRWLDWHSVLTPAPGRAPVRLSGAHYFGLGMRFLPAWTGKAEFLWQDEAGQTTVRGDEKLTPGQWCAVRGAPGGRPVTLLMVAAPSNTRSTLWFTMVHHFCYLSATQGLCVRPLHLAAGEKWSLRYGIAVMDGKPGRARLDELARRWRKHAAENHGKSEPKQPQTSKRQ